MGSNYDVVMKGISTVGKQIVGKAKGGNVAREALENLIDHRYKFMQRAKESGNSIKYMQENLEELVSYNTGITNLQKVLNMSEHDLFGVEQGVFSNIKNKVLKEKMSKLGISNPSEIRGQIEKIIALRDKTLEHAKNNSQGGKLDVSAYTAVGYYSSCIAELKELAKEFAINLS